MLFSTGVGVDVKYLDKV